MTRRFHRTSFLLAGVLLLTITGCTPRPPTHPPSTPFSGWHIDLIRFRASAHGNLDCAVCHPDIPTEDAAHPDPARLTQDSRALYDYGRCASCHPEAYVAYEQGVHAAARMQAEGKQNVQTPTCGHCHNAHYVPIATRGQVIATTPLVCGDCHAEALKTYQHDYHGKAVLLGRETSATCADCHGAHNVRTLRDPDEAVQACRRCHPQAPVAMAGYYVHAQKTLQTAPDDPDRQNFALFFWVQLFFVVLTASVLTVFYTHTALWFLRSLHERLRRTSVHTPRAKEKAEGEEYWRFNIYHRLVHLLVMTSFFLSTISGMPLKYPTTGWAQWLTRLQGGVEVMGVLHRISAVVIAIWCLMHLAYIIHYVAIQKRKPWGPDTPVPSVKDFKDIWQNFLYFIGKGSRPLFDRFAYFEKFDYWAVFWGVPVIGLSGLVLWFPEFFSRFLPGIIINIAHIMHSDEALLAVGFIYIVHLFNTHIRWDKFPLNKVIFTGRESREELEHERPLQWERMQKDPQRAEEMKVR